MLVGAYEGGFLCTDLEADLRELLVEVSVGFNCLPGHSLGILACGVKSDVIHPAGEVDVLALCMPGRPWLEGELVDIRPELPC